MRKDDTDHLPRLWRTLVSSPHGPSLFLRRRDEQCRRVLTPGATRRPAPHCPGNLTQPVPPLCQTRLAGPLPPVWGYLGCGVGITSPCCIFTRVLNRTTPCYDCRGMRSVASVWSISGAMSVESSPRRERVHMPLQPVAGQHSQRQVVAVSETSTKCVMHTCTPSSIEEEARKC